MAEIMKANPIKVGGFTCDLQTFAKTLCVFVARAALGPGRAALELGCGTGLFLEQVARSGASFHGLDLSMDLLARARLRLASLGNVRLHCGHAEEMPFPDARN